MPKMVRFYHLKKIDMLKLGCILPNLAKIFLHKSTSEKFYPFCENDRDTCKKIREVLTGGPLIVFTRKAVVDKIFIRDFSNICNSIAAVDASQLYPYSMCPDMPTRLYFKWEFGCDMQKFKARHNRSYNCENLVMSYLPETRPEYRI